MLGAELFRLVEIGQPRALIAKPWFAFPATAVAFAAAVHVTDMRAGLMQGAQDLLHGLLSWLLLVATGLIVAFLLTLPFTGLAPLWRTSHGSEIVLAAAMVLVLLINTIYRDGSGAGQPPLLRWAGTVAALCLPVLVAISTYGLALRIEHRGLTNYRTVGVACLVVAACFAIGYAWAAVASRPWLKRLEATNLIAAGIVFTAIVALTTPIADPARLSVADQVARLRDGRTPPAEFDFKYLRFDAGRYGRDALEQLKSAEGPDATAIRQGAERALALTSRYQSMAVPTPANPAAIPVFPTGEGLPQSFLQYDWDSHPQPNRLPQCLVKANVKCEAIVIRDAGGQIAILVHEGARVMLLQEEAGGGWRAVGTLSDEVRCPGVLNALRSGTYRWVVPQWQSLEVDGRRLTIVPRANC